MPGVPAADFPLFPAFVQFFAPELPDGLEHPVAQGALVLRLGQHERLVHQRREEVQHHPRLHRLPGPDRLGRLQIPAADENRQPAEQRPFGLAQEVVAPLEGRPQRPLARGRRAVARGQKPQWVLAASPGSARPRAPSSWRPRALWQAVCRPVSGRAGPPRGRFLPSESKPASTDRARSTKRSNGLEARKLTELRASARGPAGRGSAPASCIRRTRARAPCWWPGSRGRGRF